MILTQRFMSFSSGGEQIIVHITVLHPYGGIKDEQKAIIHHRFDDMVEGFDPEA